MTTRQARAGGRRRWYWLVGVVSLIGCVVALTAQVAPGPAVSKVGTSEVDAGQFGGMGMAAPCGKAGVPGRAAIGQPLEAGVRPFIAPLGEVGSSAEGEDAATLYPGPKFPVGTYPSSVVVADVNGDGHPDLVTANYGSNDVSVLLSQGDGTFTAQARFPAGAGPSAVAVADVNGDGHPDLVIANANPGDVSVLLHR